jgi:hypothetical protein
MTDDGKGEGDRSLAKREGYGHFFSPSLFQTENIKKNISFPDLSVSFYCTFHNAAV